MWELAVKYPISSVPTFITIVPIIILMYRMGKFEKPVRYFFLYLIIKLSCELVMFHMASKSIQNLHVGNVLIVLSFVTLSAMFHELFASKNVKRLIIGVYIVFTLTSCFDYYRDGIESTFRYTGLAYCFAMVLFCITFFYKLIEHPVVPNIIQYSMFWIVCGLLVYCAPNVFIIPLNHYLDVNPGVQGMDIFITIPYLLEIFYMSLISVGFLISKQ